MSELNSENGSEAQASDGQGSAPTDTAPKPTPPGAKESAAPEVLPDDHPLVTALATLKAENKALKSAADSGKSEAEKTTERIAEIEARATQAEARALRREVALEHSLTKEDAALLDGISDEAAVRALAERLAQPKQHGNSAPLEGTTPKQSPGSDEGRTFLRQLTGRD